MFHASQSSLKDARPGLASLLLRLFAWYVRFHSLNASNSLRGISTERKIMIVIVVHIHVCGTCVHECSMYICTGIQVYMYYIYCMFVHVHTSYIHV